MKECKNNIEVIVVYDIYYFSGTGNTKALGQMIQKRLKCYMYSIEDKPIVKEDMIIMFPIYGFGTPALVLDWIDQLEDSSDKVAIICSGADNVILNHSASVQAIHALEAKGYRVVYDRIVIMPSNFFMAYPDDFCKQLIKTAEVKAKHICKDLENNVIRRYDNSLITKLIKPFYYGESKLLTKMLSKCLAVSKACTKC